MKTCRGCGGVVPPTRARQARYCSLRCRKRINRLNHIEAERAAVRCANARRYATDKTFRFSAVLRTRRWRDRQAFGYERKSESLVHPQARDRHRKARAQGFRSGLEVAIARQLNTLGVDFQYEILKVPFLQPQKPRFYRPDVILPNSVIIELKGRFVTADRQKHKLVKEQHPHLDIRFVFSNSRQRISKQSKTTYAAWCQTHGFLYADKEVPLAWLQEPEGILSSRAIRKLMEE